MPLFGVEVVERPDPGGERRRALCGGGRRWSRPEDGRSPLDLARTEKSASVPANSDLGPGTAPPTAPSAEDDSRTADPAAVGMGVGGSWGPSSRRQRLTDVGSLPSGGWDVGSFRTGKLRKPASLLRNDTVATRRSSAMSWSARPRKLSGRLTASATASTGR